MGRLQVIGAEPAGTNDAADMAAALRCGHIVAMRKPDTIADGLQGAACVC